MPNKSKQIKRWPALGIEAVLWQAADNLRDNMGADWGVERLRRAV